MAGTLHDPRGKSRRDAWRRDAEEERMNTRKRLLVALATLLAGTAVLPPAAAALQVITLKARIASQNGTTSGDFDLGDAVPARIGEQLRVSLVGTAIVGGAGREVAVPARFTVAAGSGNCSLLRNGPGWALLEVKAAGGNGLCQLTYTVRGDYQVRPGLAAGRITFKIGEPVAAVAETAPEPPHGWERDRWRRALALNALLYRAILGEEPRGERTRLDAQRIYRDGYGGVLTVATELARIAEDRGLGRSPFERGWQELDIERVGGLYRDLLHRQQSDRDLWQQDPGFRGNVDALHRKGLVAVVGGLVDSDEFRSTNHIGPR
jgi:hypothetical protein